MTQLVLSLVAYLALYLAPSTALNELQKDPYKLDPVYQVMQRAAGGRLRVTVTWETCGEENAFYMPGTKTVHMCNELKAHPDRIRFTFAHELSHAVIRQLDVPFTGSEEVAADELAAVILVDSGMEQAILNAAEFYYNRDTEAPPWDEHSSDLKRAFVLRCLGQKSEETAICQRGYSKALGTWMRLLHVTVP